jgi:hypothetical protein
MRKEGGKANLKSGGFFRIINHGDLGYRPDVCGRFGDISDNTFKLPCYFIAVCCFTALTANTGRYISDNNNAITHIGGETGKAILYITFAHKASHIFLLCLKSSDHSAGFGKYAVISHNSVSYGLSSAQIAFGKAEQYLQWSPIKYSMKTRKGQAEGKKKINHGVHGEKKERINEWTRMLQMKTQQKHKFRQHFSMFYCCF